MKTLGIIPARGGSKGIPRKNIRLLCGKPLITYTIEAALASRLDRVVVSTEDAEIASVARASGTEVIMRSAELAQDNTPTLPVLLEVIKSLGSSYDVVATLQPTSPLRTSRHIDEALDLFAKAPEANALVSVCKVPHNMTPGSIMSMNSEGYVEKYKVQEDVLRRQDKPDFYARNGAAIYLNRIRTLSQGILTGKIVPYFMASLESIDIDELEDFQLVEMILKHHDTANKEAAIQHD